ncbi:GntR family transcriptional regulator [Halomonas sp. EGI 63088]|uniref:GntR family transcriptional regulator n=1 Tax=Halomonas flagellata TaxID=2920385 RepID=A0ABS9RVL5_9GAMM|nr:GntR family transcriptional regulator [Halomonas flagellata]
MSSATDRAYELIRDAVISGTYPGGMRLREEELAKRLGVSRTPVRAAIRKLVSDGLLSIENKVGAVVTSWGEKKIKDHFDVRSVLESHAAYLATLKVTTKDIQALENLCDFMEELIANKKEGYVTEFSLANKQFHIKIFEISENEKLKELCENLMDIALLTKIYNKFPEHRFLKSSADHRELIAAFKRCDPLWAQSIMRSHLLSSFEYLEDL